MNRPRMIRPQGMLLVLLTVLLASAVLADSKPAAKSEPMANGWYLAAGASSIDVGGDMDGMTSISGGGSAEIFPEWDGSRGLLLAVGYQTEIGDFEFSRDQTDLDGQWFGLPTTGEFEAWNFDFRFRFARKYRVQPFGMVGFAANFITVDDGSTDGFNVADAEFRTGLDFRLGAGATVPITPRLVFNLQGAYRFGDIDSVDAIASGDLADSLDAKGTSINATLRWVFSRKK